MLNNKAFNQVKEEDIKPAEAAVDSHEHVVHNI